MAFDGDYLWNMTGMAPGRGLYCYHTTDLVDVVEDAGYFNNKDDNLNLAIGDIIEVFTWSATPFGSGNTLTESKRFVVTNVIANDAAASAGNVNIAEIAGTGGISSGA